MCVCGGGGGGGGLSTQSAHQKKKKKLYAKATAKICDCSIDPHNLYSPFVLINFRYFLNCF